MTTDIRKHQAPAGGETPRRQVINDLSLSIRDPIPVANVTERAQLLAALPSSTSAPLYVHRADAPAAARLEYSDDGATWRPVGAVQAMGTSARASDFTGNPGTWVDATGVITYDFVTGGMYQVIADATVSIGGAAAVLQHRILVPDLYASPAVGRVTMPPGEFRHISNHGSFVSTATVTRDLSFQVNVPAPATGVVVYTGNNVSITRVG